MSQATSQASTERDLHDLTGGFTGLLGLELVEATCTTFVARWPIGPQVLQPFGLVHGGAYAAVVETAGSVGACLAVQEAGGRAAGVSNTTDFFRPVTGGVLDVVARAVHQGRSQQVWEVEFRDEGGRLTARGSLRLHNLYPPTGSGAQA